MPKSIDDKYCHILRSIEFILWDKSNMGGSFGYHDGEDTRLYIQLEKEERFVGLKFADICSDVLMDLQLIIARKP